MPRGAECNVADARIRLQSAQVHLEVAETVVDPHGSGASASAAASDAVLAGIAASDAICCARLGRRHRGEDHRGATELLRTATADGKTLATTLNRLLGLKDAAQYGTTFVSASKAENAVRWARRLVERAAEEVSR